MHTVEIPTGAYRSPYCQYKYCVISDAVKEFMISPYEFIMGNTTRPGGIIDRLLSLNTNFIKKGGKCHIRFNYITNYIHIMVASYMFGR